MEHLYAVLLLNETGAELNERNLTAVLEAAGCDVTESRTKALVAALEGVEVDEFAAPEGVGDEGGAQTGASALTSADGDTTLASPDRDPESAAPADSADESAGGPSTEAGE